MLIDSVTGEIAESVLARGFLYDDPDSFRAGVEETLRALRRIFAGQEPLSRTA